MKHILALIVALAVVTIFFGGFMVGRVTAPQPTEVTPTPLPEETMCTQDAFQCPDGSYVGRTGPDCEFICPTTDTSTTAPDIVVQSPLENAVVGSPLTISGEARGPWFFEASFPVSLVNWDGLIIAEGVATATGDWMTTDLVPFTATLKFTSPYKPGDPDFMKRGTVILKKDNPSGLPEHDAALEVPVSFAP